jgi:hypothetical protein
MVDRGRVVVGSGGRMSTMPLITLLAVTVFAFAQGCAPETDFDPPTDPAHDETESEWVAGLGNVSASHAGLMETPFLCRDPATGNRTACPTDGRPDPQNLSCDAAGCHGDTTFDGTTADEDRHLDGSDGPSCWLCHDKEWSERMSP